MTRRPDARLGFAALLCIATTTGVSAQQDPALYQATAIVTGTDMRQRPLGFAETLTEVLVKVAGAPKLVDDPRVAALAAQADTLVASYTYVDPRAWFLHHDDQGTYDRSYELTVHFDPAKIDAALAALGAPPWRGPRPLLTPIVIVRRDEDPYFLSIDAPRAAEMREAIIRIAASYGLGVHFPTADDIAAWGLPLVGFPAPLGAPDPHQLRVTGSLAWDVHAMGWVGTWRLSTGGAEHEWQISGVGFDQAFENMIRGAVLLAHGTGTP
ncbi:MAG TPA: DUF2066 domain-containing protein [Acetobacteraceae bacterium]|nr:DUF2066 domain-containing protein [Acetobacteraceae bacterium]